MNVDLEGFHNNCKEKLMGDFFCHRDRYLSERQTRILVNYCIEKGIETLRDIPDEIADEICTTSGDKKWDKYDDTPDFISFNRLERTLHRIANCYNVNFDPDELFNLIKDEC